jgi:hypothetical protein
MGVGWNGHRQFGGLKRRAERAGPFLQYQEPVTLMRVRGGHKAAGRLGEFLLASQVLKITDVTAQVRAQAWSLFVQHHSKNFSFTECTSFAIMRELGLTDAFAFDNHVTQMGLRVWSAGSALRRRG